MHLKREQEPFQGKIRNEVANESRLGRIYMVVFWCSACGAHGFGVLVFIYSFLTEGVPILLAELISTDPKEARKSPMVLV